ncbi:MAG: DUF1540 domain-containing protein [Oscillospiraceae bacterium]
MNENLNNKANENALPGVNCDAKDCVHHDGICNCTASFINVKTKNSLMGASTECETFHQK